MIVIFVVLSLLVNPGDALRAQESDSSSLYVGAAALEITPVDKKGRLWQEPYIDTNDNGRYDAPHPRRRNKRFDPFTDLNGNKKWDGPFLAGYKHKKEYYVAKGVHDPLWARAIVIESNDTKIALVALDLVGLFNPEVQARRKDVADLGFDYILIASTHTHSGPDSMGLWGPRPLMDGKDPRFMVYIRSQTEKAIRKADASVAPARLSFIETQFPKEFGTTIEDRRDPIVIDDGLRALIAKTFTGETITILVNGSPHPETLGGATGFISSDFPHYIRKGLEEGAYTVGGETFSGLGGVAIYFSGSVGGLMTTLGAKVKDESGQVLPQRSFEKTQRIGELAASAVAKAVEKSSPVEITRISMGVESLYLPIDNRYFKRLLKTEVIRRMTYTKGKPAGTKGKDIKTEVGLITFFSEEKPVAEFVAIPGELFPELVQGGLLSEDKQCRATTHRKKVMDGKGRERIGAANPGVPHEPLLGDYFNSPIHFVLGLANDELGYIVPANDFVFPKYTPGPEYGIDRCGDDDHYEETVSASSIMARKINEALIEMLGLAQPSK